MSDRKLILSMQITLDGYVASSDDTADWLINASDEWADLFEDLDNADTYLLGRKMYRGYSEYWQTARDNPRADPNERRFAQLADKTEHIVFTRGNFSPDWHNTRVAHDPAATVKQLKQQGGKNIIAWGGANFAANLITLGLVDEFRFQINPTILGDGKSLFANVRQRQHLQLIDTKPLESGLVVLTYRRK